MHSNDDHSSAQRTPGASSNEIVPTPTPLRAVRDIGTTIQAGATSPHDEKQQMQLPFIKCLAEVHSPGTPGSQKASSCTAAPAATGTAELEIPSVKIASLAKWQPLPCLPCQIVAAYAFVVDGSVSPDIDSTGSRGEGDTCLTAVDLTADDITALCEVESREVCDDAPLVRTGSMDALVQVHVVAPSSQDQPSEAIAVSSLRGPAQSSDQPNNYIAEAAEGTPSVSRQQVEQLIPNLRVPLQPTTHVNDSSLPAASDSNAQTAAKSRENSSLGAQHYVCKHSPGGELNSNPLTTPKVLSRTNSCTMFSDSNAPTSTLVHHERAVPPQAPNKTHDEPLVAPSTAPQPLSVPVPDAPDHTPTHKNSVSITKPWQLQHNYFNAEVFQATENTADICPPLKTGGEDGLEGAPSSASDFSSLGAYGPGLTALLWD